jgi:hypothetical protein
MSNTGFDLLAYHLQPKTRFMIDATSFVQGFGTDSNRTQLKDELGPSVLASEEPPGEEFVLLLPAETVGFHMHDKKWSVSRALPSVLGAKNY